MQDTRLVRTCVDGDDHTLVLRRSPEETSRFDAMFDLLPDAGPTDALAITYQQSERFLHEWRERIDSRPRNVGVLSVGERMRSAASSAPTPAQRTPLRGVADPTDTEEILDTTAQYLDAWPADGRTVVYFDSVTALATHLDAEASADFLERFCRALDARDAVGYFCLTPANHERAVVRQIASLFDTVVECVETAAEPSPKPTVSDCFDAMADARRRYLLAALADGEQASVAELADRVAPRVEADREALQLSLVNVHLPKLADLGLVAFDRGERQVAPGEQFEWVVPYLRKARDVETVEPGR